MANTSRTLEIVLKLRDEAKAGLTVFSGNLDKLQPQFKAVAIASGAAFAAITGGVLYAAKAFSDAGDELAKMSQRTGMTVQSLSELKFAADLSGTSIESVEVASRIMSRTLVDAAQGMQTAKDALSTLGLTTKDFAGLNPDEAFMKMATAVAGIQDPTVRAATAMDVFGRSGTQLLPLLSKGAAGLEEMRKQAHEAGQVFGLEAARRAEEFSDKVSTLKASMQGVAMQVGSAVLPILTRFLDVITPIIQKVIKWVEAHPKLTAGLLAAAAAVTGLVFVMSSLALAIGPVIIALSSMGIALAAAAGPIGIVLGLVALAGGAFGLWAANSAGAASSMNDVADASSSAGAAMGSSLEDIAASSQAFKQLGEDAKNTAKQIADVEKNITDVIKDSAKSQQTYKENLAQAFIDQEKKVADLTAQIKEKASGDVSAQQQKDLAELQTKLTTEQAALGNMAVYRAGIAAELVEMKRRSELTEFELRVENLMRQHVADLAAYKEKIDLMMQERAELKKHLADLTKQQQEYTINLAAEETKRVTTTKEATAAIVSSMAERASFGSTAPVAGNVQVSYPTLAPLNMSLAPRMAAGGIVTRPTMALIGEAGPEAVVPLSRGMGGVTVIVNGDVSGTDLIEKVKEALMRSLRLDTKFAI